MTTASPAPTHPLTPLSPPAPDDQVLLAAWFEYLDPITEISRQHNLALRQIAAWARRPDIAEIIATLRELHEERAKLQLILAAQDAIVTLKFITLTEHPNNTNEIARRAAEGILRRCPHLNPKGSRVATTNPPPTPTPSPASPPPSPPPPPPPPRSPSQPTTPPHPQPKPPRIQPPAPAQIRHGTHSQTCANRIPSAQITRTAPHSPFHVQTAARWR